VAEQATKHQQHYLKPEIKNGREFSIFAFSMFLEAFIEWLSGGENLWCEDPEGQHRLKRKLSCGVLDESLSDCEVSRGEGDILSTCTS